MNSLQEIKGQNNAVRSIKGCLENNRIANGYLFGGPRGVGRALCAKIFAKSLICPQTRGDDPCGQCSSCRRIDRSDHPDISWLKPEKNRAIKIQQIRQLRERLSLKPYESPVSLGVIEDAHLMTQQASNALLKILEEPPASSLLILISDKKELLLDTVVSRCSEIKFFPLPEDITVDILVSQKGLSRERAQLLACFSQGSPGRAIEMLENEVLQRREEVLARLDQINDPEMLDCMIWDTFDKDQLIEDREMLVMFLRDMAMIKTGMSEKVIDKEFNTRGVPPYFEKCSAKQLYDIMERLIGLKRALLGHANPKLAAQSLPGHFFIKRNIPE